MYVNVESEDHLGPRAKPPLLVRVGLAFVLFLAVLFAGVASLVSYREDTTVPITLASTLPVASRASGRIHFLAREGELVEPQQLIAIIEAPVGDGVFGVATVPPRIPVHLRAGDTVNVYVRTSLGIERRPATIKSVGFPNAGGAELFVLARGQKSEAQLTIPGSTQSVLRRLLATLGQ